MLDLQIHLRQRFLHVLNVLRGSLHQVAAVTHQRAHGAYFAVWPECRPQQSDRMQKLQPLALMPLRPPARYVLHVSGVYQTRSDSMLLQNIVDAILAGERDPAVLAELRDHRMHASQEIVQKSLVGNWKHEHLFTLKQSRQIHQQYRDSITACDAEIEKLVVAFEPRVDPAERPLPPDRKENPRKRKKRGAAR